MHANRTTDSTFGTVSTRSAVRAVATVGV
jgi:hypothetical protein